MLVVTLGFPVITTTMVSRWASRAAAQDLESRDLRHVEVDEHDVELAALDRLECLFAAADSVTL